LGVNGLNFGNITTQVLLDELCYNMVSEKKKKRWRYYKSVSERVSERDGAGCSSVSKGPNQPLEVRAQCESITSTTLGMV